MSRLRKIEIPDKLWSKFVLNWEKEFDHIFWGKINKFANNRSLIIECCCGKGEFLVEKARSSPSQKFIGIDYDSDVLTRAVKLTNQNNCKNIIYLYNDIRKIFKNFYFPLKSKLDKIYINFPDPWPKKRHWKRRVIQTVLLKDIHKVMNKNTALHIVTDHDEYVQWIKNHLSELKNLFRPVYNNWYTTKIDNLEKTTYMEKAVKKGNTIYQFIVKKSLT
ncbi:MAG: tRNA (guanosine(46)-N7)-methyltransferase TrmB [Candidatus Mcinerneyibacterium aminivorans]|uniref:tRNA (guanine-N(7)-)-methyltransferase n=1 Tax=Candidatus Mcinerneyibacterium aminivorans TaxID=2703815 RepID=A0A5D0MJW5_9BACT|nr:MAG: tRNA (guanosine(46)-N7)-methyltransferase TrmB [Candidatus Mcinerneyibacterium aminivorans]